MSWFDTILTPIMWVVAWIMTGAHWVLIHIGFHTGAGTAWVLSIVILTLVMRTAMIPLFFRQIKASRGMQAIQPEMQAIQKKYKGKTDASSREAMSRETMELYRKHGTNPFASCLPILLQSPIFFALFRVLNSIPRIAAGPDGTATNGQAGRGPLGPINAQVGEEIENSRLFGAKLSDVFLAHPAPEGSARVVVIILIVAMSATMFTTQRQLTMKNMPAATMQGPMASTQKIMLYGMPFIFLFSGLNFPVGVLIYWLTTNLWSMGQQYYTIKRMPTPGSEAERRLKEHQARKQASKGIVPELPPASDDSDVRKPSGQRQQPVRKNRKKKGPQR
jgi:YidC/Oxa1 family membrane protein insertase